MPTVREYQGRVNGIFNSHMLVVDGVSGPQTRYWISRAMDEKKVSFKEDLFDRGVRGIVWHWTAGAQGLIDLERNAYNFVFDNAGNCHDGNHTIAEQVAYDWKNGIGASHTKSMNTGWLGLSLDAMAGAKQANPVVWGSNPITWKGIDAMLEKTMELCEEYSIPVSEWTTLTHAEVQRTLGVKQRNKWDYQILPGDKDAFQDPVVIGAILRQETIGKFGRKSKPKYKPQKSIRGMFRNLFGGKS